jgi:hypothetical protein
MNRNGTLEELLNDLLAIQKKTEYQFGEYKPTPILTNRNNQSSQTESKKN